MASAPVPAAPSMGSPSSFPGPLDCPTSSIYEYQQPEHLPSFEFPIHHAGASKPQELPVRMSLPGPGLQHARRNSKARQSPPALPDFTFNPGAEIKPDFTPSPTHPILEEMASNTRNLKGGRSPLPAFSFNPGAIGDTPPSGSPTKVSFGELRAGAHGRRGSGYVATESTPITSPSSTSSSPVKTEGSMPGGPHTSSLGHNAGRRHTHRRSEAVSISDQEKSAIIKENALSKHRAGSAPSTPGDSKTFFDNDVATPPTAASLVAISGRTPPTSPSRHQSTPSLPRPRVEFSNFVNTYRPRPLSDISSETEDSVSTVRHSHSLTGSINSLSTMSPAAKSIFPGHSVDGSPHRRPRTADAVSPSGQSDDGTDIESKRQRPPHHHALSDHLASHQQGSSHSDNPDLGLSSPSPEEVSPRTTPMVEKSNPLVQARNPFSFTPADEIPRPRTSPERHASIKKRKVKSWTGGIFSRKTKNRPMKCASRRNPTPPSHRRFPDSVFDNDDTVVICNAQSSEAKESHVLESSTDQGNLVASPQSYGASSEPTDTAIDIDAALGDPEVKEHQPQTGFAAARTRLHSGGMRSATDSFGNLHRRAESAPHLPFPNRAIFGVHRIGSNSSMAVTEVFDEEEEDDYLAGSGSEKTHSPTVDSVAQKDGPSRISPSSDTASNEPLREPYDQPAIFGEVTAKSLLHPQPSDSNIRTNDIFEPIGKRPASVPIDMTFKSLGSSYASSGEPPSAPHSAISSDGGHGNFDTHLSITRHQGERQLDGQILSTDDIPSLSDSISTITGAPARVSGSVGTRPSLDQREQRSLSESTPVPNAFARASKRASLASITRLIPGSSHGEKSKLRFGESAPNLNDEQSRPTKKANRISRLMHFLRPKGS